MTAPRLALCLPGGGASGALFQIGALAALEDSLQGFGADRFDLYVGSSSGATVAAVLAAGSRVERVYRALLDPADDYFPLERRHVLRMDVAEWRRTVTTTLSALRQVSRSVFGRGSAASPMDLWEEWTRLYDSVPAGLFSLDGYERFLEEHFARRAVPNHFRQMPKAVRIIAHELDGGAAAIFGAPELDHVPISRACIASMATPPLFSPVRIGSSHYFNPGPAQVAHVDLATEMGAEVVVVVNAMVPVRVGTNGGWAERTSLRDKGAMWVAHQASRVKLHGQLHASVDRARRFSNARVAVVEPEATNGDLFLRDPANFSARRAILEYAYRHTVELVLRGGEQSPFATLQELWPRKAIAAGAG